MKYIGLHIHVHTNAFIIPISKFPIIIWPRYNDTLIVHTLGMQKYIYTLDMQTYVHFRYVQVHVRLQFSC